MITMRKKGSRDGMIYEGITTYLNEHSMKVFLDEDNGLKIGDFMDVTIIRGEQTVEMECVITGQVFSRFGDSGVYSLEITGIPEESQMEYLQVLYDRIPSLPQSLTRDYGILNHMLRNIAFRILR